MADLPIVVNDTSTVMSQSPLNLPQDHIEKLSAQKCISEFKKNSLKKDAAKNWDKFYNRNSVNFFKDRNWTQREFHEMCPEIDWKSLSDHLSSSIPLDFRFLEAGCGVGNLLFPLAEAYPGIFFYGVDFSPKSINFIKENPKYDPQRMDIRVFDLTADVNGSDSESSQALPQGINLCTAVFVLSAIAPEKMGFCARNLSKALSDGGILLVRDYAVSDYAMVRFGAHGSKISDRFYARQDGTLSYFFTIEEVKSLFEAEGLVCESINYVYRETTNKKEGVSVNRCFLQGKFVKRSQIIGD